MNTPLELTVELDKFGRILIPKKMRERMHLKAGEKVRLHFEQDTLTVKPAAREPRLIEQNGFLVIDSDTPIEGDPIREIYEQRARDLW